MCAVDFGGSRSSLLGRSAWQRLTNGSPSAGVGPAVVTQAKPQIWLVERRARTSYFEDAKFQVFSLRLQLNEVWLSLAMLDLGPLESLGSLGSLELGLVHGGVGTACSAAHLGSVAQKCAGNSTEERDCLSHLGM